MAQIVYLKSYLNSFSLDAFYSGVWDTVMLNNLYQEIWKNSLVLMKHMRREVYINISMQIF